MSLYSDARTHLQGPSRSVRLHRVCTAGSGAIAREGDPGIAGVKRLVVGGKESLRILRSTEPNSEPDEEREKKVGSTHKSTTSRYGFKLDASRNLWEGSGLKVDSAVTDVGWGTGAFSNKILTSGRNGELMMWDLAKSGGTKFERRSKDHIRAIQKLSISPIVQYYCVTGSADGDVRVWDMRDLSHSLMRIHHPAPVRSLIFSNTASAPLQIVVGLDNGSIYRWDLQIGQKRPLDKLVFAHTGAVLALDWSPPSSSPATRRVELLEENVILGGGGGFGTGIGAGAKEGTVGGITAGKEGDGEGKRGWIVSGAMDRTVKVWDASLSRIPNRPTYTLHPSFPVRRAIFRPGYECEIAVVSNDEFPTCSGSSGSGGDTTVGGGTPIPGCGGDGGSEGKGEMDLGRAGDAIEIWDVRRGWIAKWAIGNSTSEGGVADITFADPYTLWAQHISGTFSQLDIRNAIKPIDAVPRSSVAWEAGGALAFVSGNRARWEVPYDDIHPDKQSIPVERKVPFKPKRLGDLVASLKSQSFGTYAGINAERNVEALAKLARGYVFEGADRREVCGVNAEMAYHAGKEQAAQVWLLMGSLLSDIVPPPTPPPTPPLPPALAHAISAPGNIQTTKHRPLSLSESTGGRAFSSEPVFKTNTLPSGHSNGSPSRPESGHLTPVSSNPNSPHRAAVALPPNTPAPRRPSVPVDRRGSTAGLSLNTRRGSHAQGRPSISLNESPSESMRNSSHSSHRHVGEGALDDSDSSDSVREEESDSNEETGLKPLISPYQATRVMPTTPSPLSYVTGRQQWTEDEADDDKDESSPSPGSTDTESGSSGGEGNPRMTRPGMSRRNSSKKNSRSRSSTVASLAAPSFQQIRATSLAKQESQNNIKTLIMGDTSVEEPEDTMVHVKGNNDITPESKKRQRSKAVSSEYVSNVPDKKMSEKRRSRILSEEEKFRTMGWDVLKDAFKRFSEGGDVQMCAMLSAVASTELDVGKKSMARYLEAYIDILTRLQLHKYAAYVRKYAPADEIRAVTRVETITYTSCAKCRKSMTMPSARSKPDYPKGCYSICRACQSMVKCAICHLPVRTLLFQCSVCSHGGHQECYRRFYMDRPTVELSMPESISMDPQESRGRSLSTIAAFISGSEHDDESTVVADAGTEVPASVIPPSNHGKVSGHPCAAGCGHFCWAAIGV